MILKEELHHLIETLDEGAAVEALSVVRILAAENEPEDDETAQALLARAKPFTFDDPLWNIVGMIDGESPIDVSGNKYHYLAEAYTDHHFEREEEHEEHANNA
jgi:hypothetical protein